MLTLSSFSSNLFILLLGFLLGNLFPTFFGEFLGKIFTPLFLLISLDSFNYFYYSKNSENFKKRILKVFRREPKDGGLDAIKSNQTSNQKRESGLEGAKPPSNPTSAFSGNGEYGGWGGAPDGLRLERFFNSKHSKSSKSLQNSLKIGFLFGLFVDAFKVGS